MEEHNCQYLLIQAMQEQARVQEAQRAEQARLDREKMDAFGADAQMKLSDSEAQKAAIAQQAEADKLAIAQAAQQREQELQAQLSANAAAAQQLAVQAEARTVEIASEAEQHLSHQAAVLAKKDQDIALLQHGAETLISSSERHFAQAEQSRAEDNKSAEAAIVAARLEGERIAAAKAAQEKKELQYQLDAARLAAHNAEIQAAEAPHNKDVKTQ